MTKLRTIIVDNEGDIMRDEVWYAHVFNVKDYTEVVRDSNACILFSTSDTLVYETTGGIQCLMQELPEYVETTF